MGFNPEDLYLTSGTAQLLRAFNSAWVDDVHKHGSNDFYNWEADNLPLHDLDQNTEFNWERGGFASSSVTGMMFAVSDSGADNMRVFASVSSCIEALPRTIRFPVIIEICASGNLGELNLTDFEFEDNGGIEIINRGFAKALAASGLDGAGASSVADVFAADGSTILQVSSDDLSSVMADTYSAILGQNINTRHSGNMWRQTIRAFFTTPEYSQIAASGISPGVSVQFHESTANGFFAFAPNIFGGAAKWNDTPAPRDAIVHGSDGAELTRASYAASPANGLRARTTGMVYANYFNKVRVKNCAGNVFLRGICVDGATANLNADAKLNNVAGQTVMVGIDVVNSDIVIENCAVVRCKEAGLRVRNSSIVLNRGFIAYSNQRADGAANFLFSDPDVRAAGLLAYNSTITLSATDNHLYEKEVGFFVDSPYHFFNNRIGIDLNNSKLQDIRMANRELNPFDLLAGLSDPEENYKLYLHCMHNHDEGIRMKNSTLDINYKVVCSMNDVGIRATDSVILANEFTFDYNDDIGVELNKSYFEYNQHHIKEANTSGPFLFQKNGQHLRVLGNSVFTYADKAFNLPGAYDRIIFSKNNGVDRYPGSVLKQSTVPGIVVDSSVLRLIHPRLETHGWSNGIDAGVDTGLGNQFEASTAVKGALIQAKNSSEVTLRGSNVGTTLLLGPLDWQKQQNVAGIYVTNNSTINIEGPTTIAQFGIDVLAENNSVMNFQPHQRDGQLDLSGFMLSATANHTKVQLHATRSCLVADKNSVINMVDLGDYHAHWVNSLDDYQRLVTSGSTLIADLNPDDAENVSAFTSGGSMDFFANPFVNYDADTDIETFTVSTEGYDFHEANSDVAFNEMTFNNTSYGGMCLRALNGSRVNARNVHFPMNVADPLSTSAPVYDLSAGSLCGRLYIWNIADESELHASYLSVSSTYPAAADFHGPSSVFSSGVNAAASAAPASVPNTGRLSLLDSFGLSCIGNDTGKPTFENRGPFRIYFSPNGPAKWLGYTSGVGGRQANSGNLAHFTTTTNVTVDGEPYQLWAQGYNASCDVSSVGLASSLSAIYEEVGPIETASGVFFTASAFLNDSIRNRIWLDDSAMNTFANAKNGAQGTSGRPKLINYYRAIILNAQGETGDGYLGHGSGEGFGFRSAGVFDLDRKN